MSDAPSPEVSVVIPTRNRCDQLLVAIDSALAQEEVAVEVLVVDDGSTDGTEHVLSAVKGVRIIRHAATRGVATARNAGISAAAGQWVAFLDDDDVWAPWKLRRQLDAAQDAFAPWAYGASIVVDELDRIVDVHEAPSPDVIAEHLTRYNAVPAGSSNVIVRRELLRVTGGFDPTLHHLADWDLWIRLTAAHLPARSVEPLVAYQRHSANMHVVQIASARGEIARLAAKLEVITGRALDDSALPGWLADGYSRGGRHWRAAAILASAAARQRSSAYARSAAGEAARCLGLRRRVSRGYGPAPAWARRAGSHHAEVASVPGAANGPR